VGLSARGLADSELSDVPVSGGKTQVRKLQEGCRELAGGTTVRCTVVKVDWLAFFAVVSVFLVLSAKLFYFLCTVVAVI